VPSDKRQRQRENATARAAALRAANQRRANRRRAIGGGTAVLLVVGIIALLIFTSTGGAKKAATTPTTVASPTTATAPTTVTTPQPTPPTAPPVKGGQAIAGPTPCPTATSPRVSQFARAPAMCIDPTKSYTATFNTSEGSIVVALATSNVPATVNNFVVLSRYHYYDGSSLDRIDQSIDIIQGGSPTTQSIADPGPGYTIKDEPASKFTTDSSGALHGPFTYSAGDLVMARGSAANSAAAQYFFVAGPNGAQLNGQGTYVTFGHVTTGLSILQNIERNLYEACPSGAQTCLGGAPSRVVLVKSITITEQ
jgi:cyclophilin family peptidyl-prolyl cis-trans isomerase